MNKIKDGKEKATKWDRFWRLVARKTPNTIIGRFLALAVNLVLVIGAVWWMIHFFRTSSRGRILFVTIFVALSILLVCLLIVFPSLKRFYSAAGNAYGRFIYWYLVTAAPIMFFFWLAPRMPNKSKSLQSIVFVAWGLLLIFGSTTVFTEKYRNRFFPWLQRKVGKFAPCAYALNLLFIAWLFFSSVTYVLVKNQVLSLERPPIGVSADVLKHPSGEIVQGEIANFYAWHFVRAIPLLSMNETLRWKEPLIYSSGSVGILLVLFQLMVILPVIRAFVWYWKHDERAARGAVVVYRASAPNKGSGKN
jgi:hypothetical protein